MSKPPSSKQHISNRYQGNQKNIPSMATPRTPEPPNRLGFAGVIMFFGIFGGLIWLMMFALGLGPYRSEFTIAERQMTRTVSELVAFVPTATLEPAAKPTDTPAPIPTPSATFIATPELYPFVLDGEPEPVPSVMIRPQLGCEWLVIAGQVWDLEGEPVTGLTLHLYGELGGFTIDRFVLSGSENAVVYGRSGYEFTLEDLVVTSTDGLQIQLVDTNGLPLSLAYKLQTYEDCQRNLILVNFKQVRAE